MATKNWRGDAPAVAEIKTITVGGTWANADTATMTINGKDIVVTFGAGAPTTAQVAAALKAAWEGDAVTAYGETRSETGDDVPEFAEVTATVAASVVTLTHDTEGVPFTLSVSETSAAGTLALATPTAATGPNNLSDADNWSPSGVPIAGDDVWIDEDVSLFYNLDALTAVTLNSLTITNRFGVSGKIGLPRINSDGTNYFEYRPQFLELAGITTTIEIQGNSSRIKINTGATAAVVNIAGTGTGESSDIPAILWKGTNANNELNVRKGQVGVAMFPGETATIGNLRCSYETNVGGDANVTLGSGVTWTTIDQSGGIISTRSGGTTLNKTAGETTIGDGSITTLNLDGGEVYYNGNDTLTTVRIGYQALLDLSRDMRSCTITTLDIFSGGKFKDPYKRAAALAFDLERCSLAEIDLDLGSHFKITRGTVT